MLKSYYGIEGMSKCTVIVEKSRFLCFAIPIFSKKNIVDNLKKIRAEYNDATHICYAYILNENGVLYEKYFDDNEPSGTAGRPICAVLKKRNLTNVLVVVVRYFGKVKLGASGLTRTYGACASQVLDLSKEHKYMHAKKLSMSFNSDEYFKYVHVFGNGLVKTKNEYFENDICHVDISVYNQDEEAITMMLKSINPDISIESVDFYI